MSDVSVPAVGKMRGGGDLLSAVVEIGDALRCRIYVEPHTARRLCLVAGVCFFQRGTNACERHR